MSDRRDFIKTAGITGIALASGLIPFASSAKNKLRKISILHTNDLHSRIEAFPDNHPKFAGRGGFQRINSLVSKIRSQEKDVLLLDCGDMFQGTPYFNIYKGELELKLMSMMGYDAGTIGNHEFDNGIEGITSQLHHAKFPLINSNYDFTGSKLEGKIPKYKIFTKSGIRIGIFGVGHKLEGLVAKKNYENIIYQDPIEVSNKMVKILRDDKSCDIIICLSHLGYQSNDDDIYDTLLAKETSGIDIILGGHTHTELKEAEVHKNKIGDNVIINQVGWAGITLGRINIYIDSDSKKIKTDYELISIDNKLD